jgi:hypothetical protein
LEAPQPNTPDLLGFLRRNQLTQAKAKAQPKTQARKRQAEDKATQEGKAGGGPAKQAKSQNTKRQEPQLTTKEVADRRKTLVKEGFAQVFRRRPQDTREGPSGSGQLPVTPGPQATEV